MTNRPIFARMPQFAGVALAVLLGTAPDARAGCGDPVGPNVDLSGCWMVGSYLLNQDLSGANLAGANLAYSYLGYTNLTGANLTGANLTGANLTGANLTGADLTGADLSGAMWNLGWTCAVGSSGTCN